MSRPRFFRTIEMIPSAPKAFRNAFDNVQRVARGDKPLWVIPELR